MTTTAAPTPIENLWTVKEVMTFLAAKKSTVYDLVHRGTDPLPHVLLGSRYRFEPALVRAWVAKNRSTTPSATVLPIARAR
jgi:excisionase family DNA binding protein